MGDSRYVDNSTSHTPEDIRLSADNDNAIFDIGLFTVDFSKGIRKFWYIVLILALLSGILSGYLKHTNYVPMYRSSVSFSVTAVSYNSAGNIVSASFYDNSSASQLSKTFPYIVNTSMMRNALKDALGTAFINGQITAESVATDSNIFKVTVSSNSPQDAFDIVNAVIDVYPDVAKFVVGNIQLNILIKPAMAEEPYTYDNYLRTGVIMALVGVCGGFALIGVYAFFRNTLRKKDDFKKILNQKCFVEIPFVIFHRKTNDKKAKDRLVLLSDKHPTFKESFRLLRKRLLRNLKADEKIIAVSASVAGEGKTTIAYNLAHTLAMDGKKTAVVDFDLKNRKLQRYLGLNDNKGFCDLIADKAVNFESVENITEKNLSVFTAGKSDIIFSEASVSQFFEFLRNNFDYVIVIISAAGDISNSVAVSNMCDSILLVAKQDSSSVDKNRKCLETFSFSRARILGFVFNGVQEGFSGYGGYYSGGKYGYGTYGFGRTFGRYGYGKYGYGKYGYGKYGYGKKYGYGHGYGYGYGYGHEHEGKHKKRKKHSSSAEYNVDIFNVDDSDIPDNSL